MVRLNFCWEQEGGLPRVINTYNRIGASEEAITTPTKRGSHESDPGNALFPSANGEHICVLFDKISSNVANTRLAEIRKQFLKGFIGDKLQEPLPKCPIECMFWDWIYTYYPDNDISAVR